MGALSGKLILWDLDGTLIDTIEDLGAAVDHALGLRGLPLHSTEEYRRMVGHGVRNLVTQALPSSLQDDEALVDAALADFREYYSAHIDVHTRPYPGMQELLETLQRDGARMAVTSNKFQEGTETLVRKFFPGIDFVAILGNRPGFPLKPSPEIVAEVFALAGSCSCGRSGVSGGVSGASSGLSGAADGHSVASGGPSKADAVLVGDSPTDMLTAANGGIGAIAVSWGYRTPAELAGHRLVHSPEELLQALEEWETP